MEGQMRVFAIAVAVFVVNAGGVASAAALNVSCPRPDGGSFAIQIDDDAKTAAISSGNTPLAAAQPASNAGTQTNWSIPQRNASFTYDRATSTLIFSFDPNHRGAGVLTCTQVSSNTN